ncbi:MAG: 30S ribosomal protein S2 [Candidatus Levybacteria bacterium]|nr:30S ribosomal protein S2 [Candidatus Levybacteria bacterium]
MRTVTLEELLEAGCHFGHQVTRQNPKARDYIFEARDGINIINLEKTKEGLDEAVAFVKALASKEGTSLVVLGAKRQAADIVKEEVGRVHKENIDGLFYVTNRWIGGILTNFPEITKNFKRFKYLSDRLQDPEERAKYTKKEVSLWERERQKLEQFYSGIADMQKIPDALFIIDTHLEHLAVREAMATGVKTVGITDTNADPTIIDYPIPANDDAVGSIKLITSVIIDAWIEGRKAAAKSKEQSSEGQAKEVKEKKPRKTTTRKAVSTAKEKIEETKETPEKVSVE